MIVNYCQPCPRSLSRLAVIIGQIEYRDFHARLNQLYTDTILLTLTRPAIDVVSGKPIMISNSLTLPCDPIMSEQHIVDVVHRLIHNMELHEADEHFTYRGIKLYDPHKAEADRLRYLTPDGVVEAGGN